MITIKQNKVAGFEPRWAAFAGFSVLFDEPDLTPNENFLKIDHAIQACSGRNFYFSLADGINKLDRDLLITCYLFCPLPPSSYHVTVWDGVNSDNISSLHAELKEEWSQFLDNVPGSLESSPDS